MNGIASYVRPAITAVGVERTCSWLGIRCRSLSVPSTIPSSAKMNCQERIRITKETKNGSRIRNRRIDLYRPPWKAIQ
jgi:hypothetical protein